MGTAHVLMHKNLLVKLNDHRYFEQVKIIELELFDQEGTLYNVLVKSSALPTGYNGQQEMYFKEDVVCFRRETDT